VSYIRPLPSLAVHSQDRRALHT